MCTRHVTATVSGVPFVTMLLLGRVLAMMPGLFEGVRRSWVCRSWTEMRTLEELEQGLDRLWAEMGSGLLSVEGYHGCLEDARRLGEAAGRAAGVLREESDAAVLLLVARALGDIAKRGTWWVFGAGGVVELAQGLRDTYGWVYNPAATGLAGLEPGSVTILDIEGKFGGPVAGIRGWAEQEIHTAWALRLLAPVVRRCEELEQDHRTVRGLREMCERFEDWDGGTVPWGVAGEAHDRARITLETARRDSLRDSGLLVPLEHGLRIMEREGETLHARRTRMEALGHLARSLRGGSLDPLCAIVGSRDWHELEPERMARFARTARRLVGAG